MSELHEDIRATAEDLIGDAERLKAIEQQKLALEPDDPRLAELSEEARQLVASMAPKAHAQQQLASEAEGS